jgi:hypothetical protein
VEVFDVPGIGDPDLDLADLVKEIVLKIGQNVNIDMAVIVLKAVDFRASL